MKTIISTIIALGIIAGPVAAAGFPEKAESRVMTTSKSYGGDVGVKLSLKKWDQTYPNSDATISATSYALSAGSTSTGTVKPIFSPNR